MEPNNRPFTILIADNDRFMIQGIQFVIQKIWGHEARYFDYLYDPARCQFADIAIMSRHALLMSDAPFKEWLNVKSDRLLIISGNQNHPKQVLSRKQSVAHLVRQLTGRNPRRNLLPTASHSDETGLSLLQRKIVKLIATGQRQREIAQALNINEKSVSYHKRNIMNKLNIVSKGEFHRWVVEGNEV